MTEEPYFGPYIYDGPELTIADIILEKVLLWTLYAFFGYFFLFIVSYYISNLDTVILLSGILTISAITGWLLHQIGKLLFKQLERIADIVESRKTVI